MILGYDVNGVKDILGLWIGEAEGKHYWMQIFDEIKARGVEDVLFISMDGVSGLEEGAKSIFKDVVVQRCIVHLLRNSIRYIPSKDYKAFTAQLKKVYGAPSLKAAEAEFERFKQAWSQYPGAVDVWVRSWQHVEQLFNYGSAVRKVMYNIPKIDVVEYKGVNLVYLKCAAGDAGPYQAPVDVYSKRESGKNQNRTMKYWIRPSSLTTEAKQSELAELFEKFASTPFVDRINNRASMEHIRRGYLEDFIRESNSSLIEELNVRSLEDLLISEEVAEEKDEGIAIKNIGLLMFGERPDKLIAGTKIELVRFHDKEAEASDFIEKTFLVRYGNR